MAVKLSERPIISEEDEDTVSINYGSFWLDSGESLVSAIVEEVVSGTASEIILDEIRINNEELEIQDFYNLTVNIVPAGKALQFRIRGQVSGQTVIVRVKVVTDSNPARKKVGDLEILVK